MKSTNDPINITIRMIDNEQVPEWVKQHTVWVESNATEATAIFQELKAKLSCNG